MKSIDKYLTESNYKSNFSKTYVNVIVEFDNKILILRRANYMKKFPGCWGLPGGSYEESDNTIENAATRELMEETGIYVHANEMKELDQITHDNGAVSYVLVCHLIDEPVVHISREHQKFSWITWFDNDRKWMPDFEDVIKKYLESLKRDDEEKKTTPKRQKESKLYKTIKENYNKINGRYKFKINRDTALNNKIEDVKNLYNLLIDNTSNKNYIGIYPDKPIEVETLFFMLTTANHTLRNYSNPELIYKYAVDEYKNLRMPLIFAANSYEDGCLIKNLNDLSDSEKNKVASELNKLSNNLIEIQSYFKLSYQIFYEEQGYLIIALSEMDDDTKNIESVEGIAIILL